MKFSLQIIATALDMYFEGLSSRKIQRQILNIYGIRVYWRSILRWVLKYSELAGKLLSELKPSA